jgi:hemerythrin
MALRWTDELLTGDKIIDTHHKAFYLQAQRLQVACNLGRGAAEVERALKFLDEYTAQHFAHEENLMSSVGYPYLESHRAAHRAFAAQLATLNKKLAEGADRDDLARRVAEMVEGWFAHHLANADRPLIRFLAERGASGV